MTSLVTRLKIPVHIEVELDPLCTLSHQEIQQKIKSVVADQCPVFTNGLVSSKDFEGVASKVKVCDLLPGQKISFWQADIFIHAFRLIDQPPELDYLEGEEELPVAEQMELPNKYTQGLWESIIIDESIKSQLLSFSCTSILFAEANIDPNIIAWNKMLLLYGPPGTGKTSLCKALAHKVYIRNTDRYRSGLLFEVNCHSLFSKWFSESGKLVMKLFNHISEIAEDPECFVVLLVDEVESIASARNASSRSGEPGDAIRVVNAVLTSLDTLKRKGNVLVLCTSNMVTSLDEAFLDRLDFKVCIGLPNHNARIQILASCLKELIQRGIVLNDLSCNLDEEQLVQNLHREAVNIPSLAGMNLETLYKAISVGDRISSLFVDSNKLLQYLVDITEGKSGRALRKLPIKAHTLFQQRIHITLPDFLTAMIATVQSEGGFLIYL